MHGKKLHAFDQAKKPLTEATGISSLLNQTVRKLEHGADLFMVTWTYG